MAIYTFTILRQLKIGQFICHHSFSNALYVLNAYDFFVHERQSMFLFLSYTLLLMRIDRICVRQCHTIV